MQIQEVIRSCANETVAEAAVACLGTDFTPIVRQTAQAEGMSAGAFAVLSMRRFVEHGDEGELRSVLAAMDGAQEPVLAGLHRVMAIMMASGPATRGERPRGRQARLAAQRFTIGSERRREAFGAVGA